MVGRVVGMVCDTLVSKNSSPKSREEENGDVKDEDNSNNQYFTVPPPFLQESTGMGLESTGIGPESAGIHQNGTNKVQHSGYSPNGIW